MSPYPGFGGLSVTDSTLASASKDEFVSRNIRLDANKTKSAFFIQAPPEILFNRLIILDKNVNFMFRFRMEYII
jgi:hypothetical protein